MSDIVTIKEYANSKQLTEFDVFRLAAQSFQGLYDHKWLVDMYSDYELSGVAPQFVFEYIRIEGG